jgi:hypothetical protein
MILQILRTLLAGWMPRHQPQVMTSYGQNIGTHHFPDVYGLTRDFASSCIGPRYGPY